MNVWIAEYCNECNYYNTIEVYDSEETALIAVSNELRNYLTYLDMSLNTKTDIKFYINIGNYRAALDLYMDWNDDPSTDESVRQSIFVYKREVITLSSLKDNNNYEDNIKLDERVCW